MIISLFNIQSHFLYTMKKLERIIIEYQTLSLISTNFNWENIHFAPIQQDYQNFEMNSASIALTILTMNDQKEISYLCESQHNKTREKQVNLLLLESKHYTSVKKLKVFTKLITFIIRI